MLEIFALDIAASAIFAVPTAKFCIFALVIAASSMFAVLTRSAFPCCSSEGSDSLPALSTAVNLKNIVAELSKDSPFSVATAGILNLRKEASHGIFPNLVDSATVKPEVVEP